MGPHFPFAARVVYSSPEPAGDPEGSQPRSTHATTCSHCRMWTFTFRPDVHLGMDGQSRRLQAGAESRHGAQDHDSPGGNTDA
jgi:hypothetical protein